MYFILSYSTSSLCCLTRHCFASNSRWTANNFMNVWRQLCEHMTHLWHLSLRSVLILLFPAMWFITYIQSYTHTLLIQSSFLPLNICPIHFSFHGLLGMLPHPPLADQSHHGPWTCMCHSLYIRHLTQLIKVMGPYQTYTLIGESFCVFFKTMIPFSS